MALFTTRPVKSIFSDFQQRHRILSTMIFKESSHLIFLKKRISEDIKTLLKIFCQFRPNEEIWYWLIGLVQSLPLFH
jgi:hypothetical protein